MDQLMRACLALVWVWLSLAVSVSEGVRPNPNSSQAEAAGKRWAVLVAGSSGYDNYRHQADVCHAYQLLKKGGLDDENVVVFMYDDIAFHPNNPRPGVVINKPFGPDVYEGVPKDYTGDSTTSNNLYAVILGNRSAVTGGSGKVVDSGPDDTIFIYYTDHGASGVLGMPSPVDNVYAKDLIDVLKKKHGAKAYKSMVIYVEACESGSIFEGLLPEDINIYATTASNAYESSYGCYCPETHPPAPPGYDTCLGDVYSISWMEDSDRHDTAKETLGQQYETVRRRTAFGAVDSFSHVMQYGNIDLSKEMLVTYIGTDPANSNYTMDTAKGGYSSSPLSITPTQLVSQRDIHLLYLRHKLRKAPDGSSEKLEAQKELLNEIAHREHVDDSIRRIGDLLFGEENSYKVLTRVRPAGQPLVDDWDCFKTLIQSYQRRCGTLSRYGKRYLRGIANMCNAGISVEQMVAASSQACPKKDHGS